MKLRTYNDVMAKITVQKLIQFVEDADKVQLESILPDLRGLHAVQIAKANKDNYLKACLIPHKIGLQEYKRSHSHELSNIYGTLQELPFLDDSIDIVLLPHTLEYELAPKEVLEEVWRILRPEGALVILGHNPWSLLRISAKKNLLTSRCWFGISKTCKILKEIGFEIETLRSYFFRPLLKSQKWYARLGFLEIVGQFLWPFWAGSYLLVVRKRLITMTPIRPQWQLKSSLFKLGHAKPSVRLSKHE